MFSQRLVFFAILLAFVGMIFANQPSQLVGAVDWKMPKIMERENGKHIKVIVPDANYKRPPTLGDLIYKNWRNGILKSPRPPARNLPAGFEKFYGPLPVSIPSAVANYPGGKLGRFMDDMESMETMAYGGFDASDHLASVPWTRPQRQPSIATDTLGWIYAVWGEEFNSNTNAIMCGRSTNGGITWDSARVVDNVGTNFMPRADCYGGGSSARVHVAYNYLEMHIYDIYDTNGTYLGQDTSYEGDVYYSRSNNAGMSFSTYYAIANRDIDLIIMHFNYDEGGVDIAVDGGNNVAVAYYSQADEGHLISIALMLLYIILTGGLPPFFFDYTWYTCAYRGSTNGGGSFNDEEEIVNDWFVDRWGAAIDIYGVGTGAKLHTVYSEAGFLSLAEASGYFKLINNPFYSPSIGSEVYVADGYTYGGCIQTGSDGQPRVAITDDFSPSDYDVYYTHSTNYGASFLSPIAIDIGYHDSYEARMTIDLANNPFFAWTDMREGDYDIYCVWSEDGGTTLRSDQHKVNHDPGSDDQYWPDVSMFLPDSIRRFDVDWWDTRSDADGDIYFNSATWWRTNVIIQRHDPLANPMGGTVTIEYTSFGVLITRELNEGNWIIYHDPPPGATITVDGISSGSNAAERWILNFDGHDTVFTPPGPGRTYTLTYYDQYWTTFTVTKGNPPSCTHTPPTGIPFTYEYFWLVNAATTVTTTWANVQGDYSYTPSYPPGATVDRWHTPMPNGVVTSPTVSPTYYHQWNARFFTPHKMNPDAGTCACTHTCPSFTLTQRYADGTNVGGVTDLTDWSDCGSIYQYENPKIISTMQRWLITVDVSGTVISIGPYIPSVWHQWMPSIVLIGPSCPTNTACCEEYWNGGITYYDVNLCGTYQPWVDCASQIRMCSFTTLGWVARDPYIFPCVVSAFMASIRYGNVVAVTLRNDFGYGFIIADGDTYSSPAVIGWAPSSDHVVTAVTPQEFGGTRYVWDHWSDAGAVSHMVTVISDTEFVAYFDRQYFLNINADHGSPWGEGWYDEGAVANFGVHPYDSTGGIRYTFTGWTGTGTGSYTGPDTTRNVTMNNAITEDASYTVQYRLILTYTGSPIAPAQTGSGWYNVATLAPISTDSILGDDGTPGDSVRYIFDHWNSTPGGAIIGCPTCAHTSVFMDQPYVLTAVYVTQYRFWVYNPDGYDTPVPDVGSHWYSTGATVTAEVTSPTAGMYCTGYDGEGSLADGTDDSVSFVISMPSSITWHWGSQYTLEVHAMIDGVPGYSDWLLAPAGAVPPAGTHYINPGMDTTVRLTTTIVSLGPDMRDSCYGWLATGAPCSPADSCTGTGSTHTFTMTENTVWIWNFKQQFLFEVRCSTTSPGGCPFDTPNPAYGSHWFNRAEAVSCTVAASSGAYVCVGYYGSGSVPGSGWGHVWNGTITGPSKLWWRVINRSQAESIRVISSHGESGCVPPVGWNYFPRGEVVDLWTISPDEPETLDGTRYNCPGWTGTGCVPATGVGSYCGSVTVATSGTITWNWGTEHRVRIYSEYDTPHPDTGEYWYNEGLIVHAYLGSTIDTTDTGTTVYCTGYHMDFFNGDTCVHFPPFDSTDTDFSFPLNCPVDITWKWNDYLAPLYVYSAHDNPIPSDTSWWIPGTIVTAFVTSPSPGAEGERWRCTGWTGTGDVLASGTGLATSFTIWDTSSITWNWQQQFNLFITTNTYPVVLGVPIPGCGDHWYNAGLHQYCFTHSTDLWGTDTMRCTGLHGTGCVPADWPMSEIHLIIDEPGTLEWQWHHAESCAALYVISDFDTPFPYGVSYWLKGDTVDATVADWVIVGGETTYCIGWTGTGDSLPAVGDSTHIDFTIWENCTLEWDWSLVKRFTVTNPGDHDTPYPPVGTYVYPTGSLVTGYVADPVVIESDTFYCIGYYGTGDLDSVSPQSDFSFTITENSSIEWRWTDDARRLDVYSEYGSPHPYGTTYWIPATLVHATVEANVSLGSGIRAHCTGYEGTGSCPSGSTNTVNFNIIVNSTLTWLWEVEYSFNVTTNSSNYDNPVPYYGEYWYAGGTTVAGYMTTNPVYVGFPDDSMYCIGYFGSGDLPDTSHQTDFEFTITQPTACMWRWYPADTVCQLVVNSPYDNPMPYGTTYWLIGELVVADVDSVAYEGDSTTMHECRGFDVVGAIDSTDTSGLTLLFFTIDTNTVLTWLWTDQYYITLTYVGLPGDSDDYIPAQTGEGWYSSGDTAWIETETPIYCGMSYGYYGFYLWTYDPPTPGVVGDTLINATYVIVNDNYTLTAHYSSAVPVTVKKEPTRDDIGWILIDTEYHDSTAVINDWWGQGSYHYIGVPSLDSAAWGERFIFDYWSDGGDTVHLVGPIDVDTIFTAYYDEQIMVMFAKQPPHEYGWMKIDGTTYPDSTYVYGRLGTDSLGHIVCLDSATTGCSRAKIMWINPGRRFNIEVSPIDSCGPTCDTARFFYDHWSDHGAIAHTTDTVWTASAFTAFYDSRWLVKLIKNPAEPYGFFQFNDTTIIRGVSEFKFWSRHDTIASIGVSEYDIKNDTTPANNDSVYIWDFWSDAGAIVHTIGPITGPTQRIAYYDAFQCTLGIRLAPTLVYTWPLDTLDPSETVGMTAAESLFVINDGNVPCDLGLYVYSCTPPGWVPSYYYGIDKFSLYAQFTDNSYPPTTFIPSQDYVKSAVTWATSTIFGPGGFNLMPAPHPSVEQQDHLWLKFVAPTATTVFGEMRIKVLVVAKYHMP